MQCGKPHRMHIVTWISVNAIYRTFYVEIFLDFSTCKCFSLSITLALSYRMLSYEERVQLTITGNRCFLYGLARMHRAWYMASIIGEN